MAHGNGADHAGAGNGGGAGRAHGNGNGHGNGHSPVSPFTQSVAPAILPALSLTLAPAPPGATRLGRPYLATTPPSLDPAHPIHRLSARLPQPDSFSLGDDLAYDRAAFSGDALLKLSSIPYELRLNWQRIRTLYPSYPIGASMAACICHGLDTLDRDPGVRAFTAIVHTIRAGGIDNSLSMHDQATLDRLAGNASHTANSIRPTSRIGQVTTWRLRVADATKDRLAGRADVLGMSSSVLGYLCAAYALAKHEASAKDFSSWALSDFEALRMDFTARAERLARHLAVYTSLATPSAFSR